MTNSRMLATREKSFDKKKKEGFSACLVKGMSPLPVAGKLKSLELARNRLQCTRDRKSEIDFAIE